MTPCCPICRRTSDNGQWWVCEHCETRMRGHLRHLPEHAAQVQSELWEWVTSVSPYTLTGNGSSGGDPAEGALPGGTDLLSASQAVLSRSGPNYDQLASWEACWREERDLTPRTQAPTLSEVCHGLSLHLSWACRSFSAMDEFSRELDAAVKVTRDVLADERTWVRLGRFKCPNVTDTLETGDVVCRGQLWVDHTDAAWPAIACRACGSRWEIAAWHLLGAALAQPVTVTEAASVLGVAPRTIQDWVKRGNLANHGTERVLKIRLDEVGTMRQQRVP